MDRPMSKKRSILFVMNTMGRAGAERALIELMRILDPEKYSIFLYVLIPRGELFNEVPEYVRILNRKTDSRSVLSAGGKLFVAGQVLKSFMRQGSARKAFARMIGAKKTGNKYRDTQKNEKIMRRALADGSCGLPGKFDLAIAYLEGPATWYVAEKIKSERKAAFIHTDYQLAGYTRNLDDRCYDVYDRIFAVSTDVKKKFLGIYPEYADKTKIFFNIINREYIRKRSLEPGGFTDGYKGVRILTVGRLYYMKGIDIAVETAAILRKRGHDFKWYLVGEGEEKNNIQRMIFRLQLDRTVYLVGACDNPYPYFKQADIYVCSSRFEGKSIVIEEAQVLGLPVIATNCSGINEQIDSGQDGVITDMNPKSLADAIENLIMDSGLRKKYGDAARSRKGAYQEGLNEFLNLLGEREQ